MAKQQDFFYLLNSNYVTLYFTAFVTCYTEENHLPMITRPVISMVTTLMERRSRAASRGWSWKACVGCACAAHSTPRLVLLQLKPSARSCSSWHSITFVHHRDESLPSLGSFCFNLDGCHPSPFSFLSTPCLCLFNRKNSSAPVTGICPS
ncbi:unnamed protein product [Menidia menidia]|uniref:(Atlantic silverside) hypothetical protein n=1 Tax=Menidia menidia TaxID=238744 RepID=A0A8S4BS71_9TELE|nr:unnamed protein product [Menidia menidia]